MIIKKYLGKTEEIAIENAKKELGEEVVIMNVKNTKRQGVLRIFKKVIVEVTVALEEERESPIPPKNLGILAPMTEAPKSNFSIFTSDIIQEESRVKDTEIANKLENLQNLLEKQLQAPKEELIESENELVVFMKLLYNTMIENEVSEVYINQIISDFESIYTTNTTIEQLLSNIYQKMILKFGKSVGISPAAKGAKVIFFVGPTGVGKTTTIAKIASKFKVDERKKIALLTADTYRIAAAEQLKTYANILDVPFRVIYSIDEGREILNDFKDYDYILVDTAGHSHNNQEQRASMEEFLSELSHNMESEVFLVLSATTKYRDLVSIVNIYTGITTYKLIFTKLDETTTLGNLLNLKLYTGADLAYVTCGQNVPEDINNFNPQKTVKLLLGGKNEK